MKTFTSNEVAEVIAKEFITNKEGRELMSNDREVYPIFTFGMLMLTLIAEALGIKQEVMELVNKHGTNLGN